jgi:hypothetical protein
VGASTRRSLATESALDVVGERKQRFASLCFHFLRAVQPLVNPPQQFAQTFLIR